MRVLKIVFVLTALILLSRCAIRFWSHNYNSAAEGNDLYGTLSLADGKPLYPSQDQVPYGVYLYAPVHAYLGAAAVWLTGQHTLRHQAFVIRFLSLIALILAIFFVWRGILVPAHIDSFTFLAVALLGLSKFADYATVARNDTLELCLEMAALFLFLSWMRGRRRSQFALFFFACCLSVWTRQTGVVFVSAVIYLLWSKDYKRALSTSVCFAAVNLLLFGLFYFKTHGAILNHLFYSNIRPWRPINRAFFDNSLLSFIASYVMYVGLIFVGWLEVFRRGSTEMERVIGLVFTLSLVASMMVFLRAGGDVNYFFETLIVGVYFACIGWTKLWQRAGGRHRSFLFAAVALQCLVISFVVIAKDRSALKDGSLPFEKIADRVREELPPYVYSVGAYGDSLDVCLRDWAYHGPDVTSGSMIGRNSHIKLRWLMKDLSTAMSNGTISALVFTTPGCAAWGPLDGTWGKWFGKKEVWDSWICVYRSNHPRPSNVVDSGLGFAKISARSKGWGVGAQKNSN